MPKCRELLQEHRRGTSSYKLPAPIVIKLSETGRSPVPRGMRGRLDRRGCSRKIPSKNVGADTGRFPAAARARGLPAAYSNLPPPVPFRAPPPARQPPPTHPKNPQTHVEG